MHMSRYSRESRSSDRLFGRFLKVSQIHYYQILPFASLPTALARVKPSVIEAEASLIFGWRSQTTGGRGPGCSPAADNSQP
jgi:hypothetical protein